MKDKIIETLRQFNDEFQEDVIADFYIEEIAARIDSLYPTLNRDKVKEILRNNSYDCFILSDDKLLEITDALCSLSLPTLSEGEIEELYDSVPIPDYWDGNIIETRAFNEGVMEGIKAALKELTKPKE